MSYAEFRRVQPWRYDVAIIDTDGSELHEDEFGSLLARIIESNDVPMLHQYKEKHRRGMEVQMLFVCFLEHYHGNLGQTASLEERDIVLLNVTCEYGQLETALFLLDSQPPLGSVGANMPGCETALLSAAQSIWNLSDELQYYENEALDWVDGRLTRSEQLIDILLDRGASVHDVTMCPRSALKRDTRTEGNEYVTLDDCIKVQDAMMGVLQDAGGSLHQPNSAGKTPRQLLEQKRASWYKESNRKTIL